MTTPTSGPVTDGLPSDVEMAAVTLHVGDLDRMTGFYRDAVGLTVLPGEGRGDVVTLGRGGRPIVVLHRTPGLPQPRPREAGLFHTAILFEDETRLAGAIASVASTEPESFVGSADHLVSQAFYFTDPEGNGLELYADRPREQWQWSSGLVQMDSLRLDPNEFLSTHLEPGWTLTAGHPELDPNAEDAVVGHVHLQVGDILSAKQFYVNTLGFEVTGVWHGALFIAAGGYHHHMAVNTWRSLGAGPRAVTLGLGEVAIHVPTGDDVAALRERLRGHQIPSQDDGAQLRFEDPWRNVIRVSAAG
jgi:catechol 2,3-dioxygenase